jgi:hypothetical protein
MFQRFFCLEQGDLKDRASSSFGGGRLAPPVATA